MLFKSSWSTLERDAPGPVWVQYPCHFCSSVQFHSRDVFASFSQAISTVFLTLSNWIYILGVSIEKVSVISWCNPWNSDAPGAIWGPDSSCGHALAEIVTAVMFMRASGQLLFKRLDYATEVPHFTCWWLAPLRHPHDFHVLQFIPYHLLVRCSN